MSNTTTREALKQAQQYLSTLPPHVREREGAKVIQSLIAALAAANAEEAKPAPEPAKLKPYSAVIEGIACDWYLKREVDAYLAALPAQVDAQPMSDFMIQIRDDAYERAAKVCDGVNSHDNPMTSRDCADAIRAFKGVPAAQPASGAVDERELERIWLELTDNHVISKAAFFAAAAALSAVNQVNAQYWARIDLANEAKRIAASNIKDELVLVVLCDLIDRLLIPGSQVNAAQQRCKTCDGTGDVHGMDGEWGGECTVCDAAQPDKDVERYAYIRDVLRHDHKRWIAIQDWNHENISPSEFDAQVDVAIAAQPAKSEQRG